MIVIAVVSTKGGVGKTTLAANIGALFADLGLSVLLVDADVQPTLSSYYELTKEAKDEYGRTKGLTQLFTKGAIDADIISETSIPNMDIVASDDPEGKLSNWIRDQPDGRFRMKRAMAELEKDNFYHVVIIDSPGRIGPLQDASVLAADLLLSPVPPETLSAREFLRGTVDLLERLKPMEYMGFKVPPMKAILYRQSRTSDARLVASQIKEHFIQLKGAVVCVNTVVPMAKAYTEAASLRTPAHRHEPARNGGQMLSAYDVMHQLVWELIPQLQDQYVDLERVTTLTAADIEGDAHE